MIQRYALKWLGGPSDEYQGMLPDVEGDYVAFADHEARLHQAVSAHTQVLTEISMALGGPDPRQEAVLLDYAELVRKVKAMAEENARLKTHRKVVGKFLSELYEIMVDPLEGPENIAQMTKSLRESALESRERLHGLPADWNKDSSLETWFPLTAEEEKRKDAEVAALKADNERLTRALFGVLEALGTRYDGADDSRTKWMGSVMLEIEAALAQTKEGK